MMEWKDLYKIEETENGYILIDTEDWVMVGNYKTFAEAQTVAEARTQRTNRAMGF